MLAENIVRFPISLSIFLGFLFLVFKLYKTRKPYFWFLFAYWCYLFGLDVSVAFIIGFFVFGVSLFAIFIAGIIFSFKESVAQGILCWFVPGYVFYYAILRKKSSFFQEKEIGEDISWGRGWNQNLVLESENGEKIFLSHLTEMDKIDTEEIDMECLDKVKENSKKVQDKRKSEKKKQVKKKRKHKRKQS